MQKYRSAYERYDIAHDIKYKVRAVGCRGATGALCPCPSPCLSPGAERASQADAVDSRSFRTLMPSQVSRWNVDIIVVVSSGKSTVSLTLGRIICH